MLVCGNSLTVQWLGLCASNAGAYVPSLVGKLRSCILCRKKKHGKLKYLFASESPRNLNRDLRVQLKACWIKEQEVFPVTSLALNNQLFTCVLSRFSHVRLFGTLWTIAHQVPLSMEFSRQGYWSELPFPTPGDLPKSRDQTPVSCIGKRVPYY